MNTDCGVFSGHPALRDLAVIYQTLDLPSPGPEDEIPDIFATVTHKLQEQAKKRGVSKDVMMSDPILKFSLSPAQWQKFDELSAVMNEEYTIRFKTLLKRLDLTLTSFKWGKNKVRTGRSGYITNNRFVTSGSTLVFFVLTHVFYQDKAETINQIYGIQRKLMADSSNLGIADVLAARADLAVIPKTSSGAVRDNTRTKLNNMVIVGKVHVLQICGTNMLS